MTIRRQTKPPQGPGLKGPAGAVFTWLGPLLPGHSKGGWQNESTILNYAYYEWPPIESSQKNQVVLSRFCPYLGVTVLDFDFPAPPT